MLTFLLNVTVSACAIGLAAGLSRRYPATAGFIVALSLWSAYALACLLLPLGFLAHRVAVRALLGAL